MKPRKQLQTPKQETGDEAPYKQGAHAQCHISIGCQLDATSAAVKPDQPPEDDNLPLTSLFASADGSAY